MTVQVTRGHEVRSLPLETVIADPSQNVWLQADDVVTFTYQPLSFTALGATGKNDEVAVSKVNSNTDTSDCLRGSRGLLGIADCHHA